MAAGPFFCSKCHEIIDPKGTLKAVTTHTIGEPAPPKSAPPRSGPSAVASGDAMTELGSPFAEGPRTIQGPGASVGGSVILGYLLAAVAGVALAAGLAWLSGNVLRLPIVYPLLIGWGIRRALAAGAGGGTPDRGPIGVVVLLAIVVATFSILRYGEYLSTDRRESEHYRAVYGGFPTADAKTVEIALRARADAEGKIWIPESKRSVDADEEIARLQGQMIAHELPTTAYDIALISAVGKKGFKGHVQKAITKGDTVAIRPQSAGWSFPGFAIVVLWIAEFALLLVSSFSRIDDD